MKKKWHIILILFICLLLSGVLGSLFDTGDRLRSLTLKISQPIYSIGRGTGRLFQPLVKAVQWRTTLRERDLLQMQVTELQKLVSTQGDLAEENASLRADLGLRESVSSRTLACPVLGQSLDLYSPKIVLGCGSDQGIREKLGVVYGGSLIGTVSTVDAASSIVRVLSHAQSTVDVKIMPGNAVGLARGSFGTGVMLDLLPVGSEVSAGDLVVTSGLAGNIPSGVLLGRIGEQVSEANDPRQQFVIEQSVVWRDSSYAVIIFP